MDFHLFAQNAGQVLDFFGILVILFGVFLSTCGVIIKYFKGASLQALYNFYRWNLARSILVGLEFLVAGDIIRSVGGQLSFDAVLVLAIIVLVRAFLGIEFQMEIEGRWPWKVAESRKKSADV
ncbi:MAG: DUF1622 domain-containing protein [Candidatus Saccharimonadales bacterium]